MAFRKGVRVMTWVLILGISHLHTKVSGAEMCFSSLSENDSSGSRSMGSGATVGTSTPSYKTCSTWGYYNFKTFDGGVFNFPSNCTYHFASDCQSVTQDFSILIRRSSDTQILSEISMSVGVMLIQIHASLLTVNGVPATLPFFKNGVKIVMNNASLMISATVGLDLIWDRNGHLQLKLDAAYPNTICGLCANLNGTAPNMVNLQAQKIQVPNEICVDQFPAQVNCPGTVTACLILQGPAFHFCNIVVDVKPYIQACTTDMCQCKTSPTSNCFCRTLTEYSYECLESGAIPQNWRTPTLCFIKCPYKMEYQEHGLDCQDTCSNQVRSQFCVHEYTSGCFCPPGKILDDIGFSGCIDKELCPCIHNGEICQPGHTFRTFCRYCKCAYGVWICEEFECPGTCFVEGGSHITTYGKTTYTFNGKCTYILSKLCKSNLFVIEGDIQSNDVSGIQTELKRVLLHYANKLVIVHSSGSVTINYMHIQLPYQTDDITISFASTYFIIVNLDSLGLSLQIQLLPIMQLYIKLELMHIGRTCGLCGNYYSDLSDSIIGVNGIVEGTSAASANSRKSLHDCPNVNDKFVVPCTFNMNLEQFAKHWCSLLLDRTGPFAICHSFENAHKYYEKCIYDTCACANSVLCACSALSSYVWACSIKNVVLRGWRPSICSTPETQCSKSLVYSDSVNTCMPTCRSLSDPDAPCGRLFFTVDGCVCKKGTFMNEAGKCVPASDCQCYYKNIYIRPDNSTFTDNGLVCTCFAGKITCSTGSSSNSECIPPMIYFNCTNAPQGTRGSECQKTCSHLDMPCVRTQCISGCICPAGMILSSIGSCVDEHKCPCINDDVPYEHGTTVMITCKTCTCNNGMWECEDKQNMGTCVHYGEGHYITFDNNHYTFRGKCCYVLAEDHCDLQSEGNFQVTIENIPCSTGRFTCSLAVHIILGNCILTLRDKQIREQGCGAAFKLAYTVLRRGMFLVVQVKNNLLVIWDLETRITLKIDKAMKGKVCGLCGDFDGDGDNDFSTSSTALVGDELEFGNHWKVTTECPDVKKTSDPCAGHPMKKTWAQNECKIITSEVFKDCHHQVDVHPYYKDCVQDACACDQMGNCSFLCNAIAAYAQACSEACICINWRTPAKCSVECDMYNIPTQNEWYYDACGTSCLKTCRNPSGLCRSVIHGLEGCYPMCPGDKPYFEENGKTCVSLCGCYDSEGHYYDPDETVPSCKKCQMCSCTVNGIKCTDSTDACCEYMGHLYHINDLINVTDDGEGMCTEIVCGLGGMITHNSCNLTTPAPATTTMQTAPCSCSFNGSSFSRGATIYYRTDSKACVFSTICNNTCHIEEVLLSCQESCDKRNCTIFMCLLHGTVAVASSVPCPPVVEVTCSSAMRVYSQDGCCYQNVCPTCTGPEGETRQPGDEWDADCHLCLCTEADGGTVQCTPVDCGGNVAQICGPGQETLQIYNPDNPCCPTTMCRDDTPQKCSNSVLNCPQGFMPNCTDTAALCPTFTCIPKAVCIVDGIEYQPGVFLNVAIKPCSECYCSNEVDPVTQLNAIQCTPVKCDTVCKPGYKYKMTPMQCCGTCVQVACILPTQYDNVHIIQPGESWYPQGLSCSFYTCSLELGKPVLNMLKKRCLQVTSRTCQVVPGQEQECCSRCDSSLCERKTRILKPANCTENSFLEVPYCEYNGTADSTDSSSCDCCKKLNTGVMKKTLTTISGESVEFHVITVEKCGCSICQ